MLRYTDISIDLYLNPENFLLILPYLMTYLACIVPEVAPEIACILVVVVGHYNSSL